MNGENIFFIIISTTGQTDWVTMREYRNYYSVSPTVHLESCLVHYTTIKILLLTSQWDSTGSSNFRFGHTRFWPGSYYSLVCLTHTHACIVNPIIYSFQSRSWLCSPLIYLLVGLFSHAALFSPPGISPLFLTACALCTDQKCMHMHT